MLTAWLVGGFDGDRSDDADTVVEDDDDGDDEYVDAGAAAGASDVCDCVTAGVSGAGGGDVLVAGELCVLGDAGVIVVDCDAGEVRGGVMVGVDCATLESELGVEGEVCVGAVCDLGVERAVD